MKSEKIYEKKCSNPECENVHVYSSKDALKSAIKRNSKCLKCATKKTEEHKRKISDALKKYFSETTHEERIEKREGGWEKYIEDCRLHGDKLRGRKRPPFSKEWCERMSESRKNSEVYQAWMKSDEYRERRRKIAVETHHSDLTYEEWSTMTNGRKIYYSQVWFYTNIQPIEKLENYEKRGSCVNDINAYHLDHIIPISYGFKQQIDPKIIGNINNLQFLPWRENLIKSGKFNEDEYRKTDHDQ